MPRDSRPLGGAGAATAAVLLGGCLWGSAMFPQTPEQRATAERVKARVAASGKWKRPITTTIEPASTWYSAEAYHQDYLRQNPGGYTCHFMRD